MSPAAPPGRGLWVAVSLAAALLLGAALWVALSPPGNKESQGEPAALEGPGANGSSHGASSWRGGGGDPSYPARPGDPSYQKGGSGLQGPGPAGVPRHGSSGAHGAGGPGIVSSYADGDEAEGQAPGVGAEITDSQATRKGRPRPEGGSVLQGTSEHDTIVGGEQAEAISGGDGDDMIDGGDGDDWIDGEKGDDVLDGGPGNDTLQGGDGDNFLDGGPGDDWLYAEHGIDSLRGGPGADTLAGGGDADTFVYKPGDDEGGADRIEDFNPGEGDALYLSEMLSAGGYAGDGSAGSLDGFLRMNGSVLEVDRDGGGDAFVPLVDLGTAYPLDVLLDTGALKVREGG